MARSRFSGVAATAAALVGGAIGFSVALFLRALIQNTPAQVKPTTFYWWFVLLTAAGALWGLATQTMKQLERMQGYRQRPLRRPRTRPDDVTTDHRSEPERPSDPPGDS